MSETTQRPVGHRAPRAERLVRGRWFVLSALAFAAALLGNLASGLFVHRAPGYLARTSTIVEFYHKHHVSGYSTVVCSAIAFLALAVFIWATSRVILPAKLGKDAKRSKRLLGGLGRLFFWTAATATLLAYLVCRVAALLLGLLNAQHLAGDHPWIHTENIAVNVGNAVIRIGFGSFIIVVALTLLFACKQLDLKLLGAILGVGVIVVVLPFLLGVGMAVWIVVAGFWLGIHQWVVGRLRKKAAGPSDDPAAGFLA